MFAGLFYSPKVYELVFEYACFSVADWLLLFYFFVVANVANRFQCYISLQYEKVCPFYEFHV